MILALPCTVDADGVTLTVRVTPKASRTAAAGVTLLPDGTTALAIRIAAPPVEGAANVELVRFVARQLGIGKSTVTLIAGQSSRIKRLRIAGAPVALAAAVAALAEPSARLQSKSTRK